MQQPILVCSHLRWDFVYQRPQQVLSRLAADRKVLFIEEPKRDTRTFWYHDEPHPNVHVYRLHRAAEAPESFTDEQLEAMASTLPQVLQEQQLDEYVLWFYTPMALPLTSVLNPIAVVYDCMDELSAFKNAPEQMLARERELLAMADVVFTGGPSLYRAKRVHHANAHCLPSSVDAGHFAQAADATRDAEDQARLPRPRLGFFGVIDERFDIGILDALSAQRPQWQFVMVGPIVKIDPVALPRRANIHYFGQRDYRRLPDYLAGWDVCLLPFARNEATRFISPTKTLEYMAAEKLIVSTPITDVAEPYGHIVLLGDTPEAFLRACDDALTMSEAQRQARFDAMRDVLMRTSWDNTVRHMSREIDRVMARKRRRKSASAPRRSTVIIGAGPTGLSAAYHLGPDALLLERNNRVGGWCRSFYRDGFTFDMAGHIMFSKEPYVHEMYRKLLGENVHWQNREAWIYSKNVHTRYPFQGCLYGLPAEVITECIVGAIEARFGALKQESSAMPLRKADRQRILTAVRANRNGEAIAVCAGELQDCCADGMMEADVALKEASHEPQHFEEFIYRVWGRGIARHFAIPYNRKLWTVDLKEMETSWLGGRVPMPDIEDMIRNAVSPACKPMGPNARFGYPLRGGFAALMNGFLPYVQNQLRLNTAVQFISPSQRLIRTSEGEQIRYDVLISTMPLPLLVKAMGDEAPRSVREAALQLRHVSVRCVNLGIGREKLTDKHWIYYPEDAIFHRIFVQGNASPHNNAPGGFGLTCEITYSPDKPLPCQGEALIQRCVADCHRVGIFQPNDPVWTAFEVDLPHAYVVYDHQRAANVRLIRDWLARRNILLAGRYSEWEYYNSDHAFVAGKHAAEQAKRLLHRQTVAMEAA